MRGPIIQFIERFPEDDLLVQHTRGLKWFVSDGIYGSWLVSTGDDENDIYRLFTVAYVWVRSRRSRFWRFVYQVWYAIQRKLHPDYYIVDEDGMTPPPIPEDYL
jgi:hypothetical protein